MGVRKVQEDFINQGTESEVSSWAKRLGLHPEQAVFLAGKMMLLKKLKYDTDT